jgi:mono/diheme cytochrome c family protein
LLWSLLVTPSLSHAGTETPPPEWAVDPVAAGPSQVERGRSVFDELTYDGVPFPFETLLAKIDRRIGCDSQSCIDAVLIPLGRSLQRMAASPDFLASPRVVAAVTGEGNGPVYARHRLYIGYQPHTALLEVISYNDEAGRFEFQLVHDYRTGGRPRTVAAERSVCVACHQNQAPIFSRPLWSETNANPAIAAAMREAGGPAAAQGDWFGVDLNRGVDAPNAIDDATDAANQLAVIQRLWRDACDTGCRSAAIRAAVKYRLSGGQLFERLDDFARQFRAAFPHGLAIPNPDLPNRDPLIGSAAEGPMQAHVPAALEALQPRPPLDTWTADDAYLDRRFILGLAAMLAAVDVARLRTDATRAFERIDAHSWQDDTIGRGSLLTVIGRPAVDRPLGRALGSLLGGVANPRQPSPPRAREPGQSISGLPAPAAEFMTTCGACHATGERSPPNFLAGDTAQVFEQLRQCAPRIFVRLANWQRPPEQWTKVPMPPPLAGVQGHPFVQSRPDPVVATLQRAAVEWLRAESGTAVVPERLLEQDYENLRPCLSADH